MMRFYCVKVAVEGRTLARFTPHQIRTETTWAGTLEEAKALFRQETTAKGEITDKLYCLGDEVFDSIIPAHKFIREQTGCSLREAVDYIRGLPQMDG